MTNTLHIIDCTDLAHLGFTHDGIYWVNPGEGADIQVGDQNIL